MGFAPVIGGFVQIPQSGSILNPDGSLTITTDAGASVALSVSIPSTQGAITVQTDSTSGNASIALGTDGSIGSPAFANWGINGGGEAYFLGGSLTITANGNFDMSGSGAMTLGGDLGNMGFNDNWHIIADGSATFTGVALTASATIASSTAAGSAGTITWDNGFVYVCVATNVWKRVALESW